MGDCLAYPNMQFSPRVSRATSIADSDEAAPLFRDDCAP